MTAVGKFIFALITKLSSRSFRFHVNREKLFLAFAIVAKFVTQLLEVVEKFGFVLEITAVGKFILALKITKLSCRCNFVALHVALHVTNKVQTVSLYQLLEVCLVHV